MKYIVFDDFFAVLGNKQRVRILQYLNKRGGDSVTGISSGLNIEQSAVSHSMNTFFYHNIYKFYYILRLYLYHISIYENLNDT